MIANNKDSYTSYHTQEFASVKSIENVSRGQNHWVKLALAVLLSASYYNLTSPCTGDS